MTAASAVGGSWGVQKCDAHLHPSHLVCRELGSLGIGLRRVAWVAEQDVGWAGCVGQRVGSLAATTRVATHSWFGTLPLLWRAGEIRTPLHSISPLPMDERRIIAHRWAPPWLAALHFACIRMLPFVVANYGRAVHHRAQVGPVLFASRPSTMSVSPLHAAQPHTPPACSIYMPALIWCLLCCSPVACKFAWPPQGVPGD